MIDLKVSWPAYTQSAAYCVPDLQLDMLASDGDNLGAEFHSNSRVVVELELLFEELQ